MIDSSIYVATGSKGLVKVGRTSNPHARKLALKRDFRLLGNEIIDFYHSEPFRSSVNAERQLIQFANDYQGSEAVLGREFFRKVDSIACIEKAKQLSVEGLQKMEEDRRKADAERAVYMAAVKKRADNKERKKQELKDKHFAEFIELQKLGLIPIPEVTTKEAQ